MGKCCGCAAVSEQEDKDSGTGSFASWRSRGKTHGALVAAGVARKQVREAAEFAKKFHAAPGQDVVRAVFSDFGRGAHSANLRKVRLGLN